MRIEASMRFATSCAGVFACVANVFFRYPDVDCVRFSGANRARNRFVFEHIEPIAEREENARRANPVDITEHGRGSRATRAGTRERHVRFFERRVFYGTRTYPPLPPTVSDDNFKSNRYLRVVLHVRVAEGRDRNLTVRRTRAAMNIHGSRARRQKREEIHTLAVNVL